MTVTIKLFGLIMARLQMRSLLDFAKFIFPKLYLDFTRGDVATALNENMQALSTLESQFNTLVMDTVNFLEDTQKAFVQADEGVAHGLQSIEEIFSAYSPVNPIVPPYGHNVNPFWNYIHTQNSSSTALFHQAVSQLPPVYRPVNASACLDYLRISR